MGAKNAIKLIIAIGGCELAGAIGAFFIAPGLAVWYPTLIKPPLTPPGWLISIVWITLYFLMGVAAFLVWRRGFDEPGVHEALAIFGVQLFLNMGWSAMFFGAQSILGAFIVIILLWLAILATIFVFSKVSRAAAYLLVPYILWVSFALYLNLGILRLN